MTLLSPRSAGIGLTLASYGVWAVQAATVKSLGAGHAVWQLIFSQSVVVLLTSLLTQPQALRQLAQRRRPGLLLAQCLSQFAATYCYFRAVTELPLATATVIYSCAPVVVVLLSALVLRERLHAADGLAVGLGLLGTVLAAGLGSEGDAGSPVRLGSALVALAAGFFWGLTVVLTRKHHAEENTGTKLLALSAVYCVASAGFVDFSTPIHSADALLMLLLGLQTYGAQWLFFEAARRLPGKLLGPLEYASILWATLLGLLCFGEVPTTLVLLGSGCIVLAGLVISLREG